MSAMRRIILTGVCSLALVLTIGFGVSAASNGRGIGILLHPNDTSAKSGSDPAQKAHKEFSGTPFEFDPEHTGIVAGDWVKHLGLPQDNDKNRFGLLLSKNGITPTNASAGLAVHGVKGLHLTELGFDVRNGGHCGAGAPRFNVVTSDGGWQRVRFFTNVSYPGAPAITAGLTVDSISIDFDEGTDIGPDFSGMVVLDNIDVNSVLIGAPGES